MTKNWRIIREGVQHSGFTPLTQDNNYDVIYKQTANYRQTEPAG